MPVVVLSEIFTCKIDSWFIQCLYKSIKQIKKRYLLQFIFKNIQTYC